ncbi:N-formylglutamate amidohydrolase [Citreimonas salinaria]|uniref:Predicted N-formylglutamate amidohydrolase n=1 Tax=Citreimonas salinaria TaxID=321339 RepID=A0A1H3GSJ7_9RHOB|nr:N-formylglutamate amidohydrolase [Citreimonas salinaria]SDY06322.1 Predicted N-formylglutamate amidohydrolase [Citreimonas salinaria]
MPAWKAFERIEGDARPPCAVLVCEHAARAIPLELSHLGLAAADLDSHAVWDIGGAALTRALADRLRTPALLGALSRLVYDCNRPPDAPSAMPAQVERIAVPGNENLDADARATRTRLVYEPFHDAVADALAATPGAALVTVHSFTPDWNGVPRSVEIGYLHDADARLARAMLRAGQGRRWDSRLNEPYSAADGVTHTLARHGAGCPSVMIEVRNDLLRDDAAVAAMADHLAAALTAALAALEETQP